MRKRKKEIQKKRMNKRQIDFQKMRGKKKKNKKSEKRKEYKTRRNLENELEKDKVRELPRKLVDHGPFVVKSTINGAYFNKYLLDSGASCNKMIILVVLD